MFLGFRNKGDGMAFSNGQNGEGNPIRGRGEYDVTSDPLNKMNGKTSNTQLFGDFLLEAMKTQDPALSAAPHSNMFDRQPPGGGNYGNNSQQHGNYLNNTQQHGNYGNPQQQHGNHGFGGHGNHGNTHQHGNMTSGGLNNMVNSAPGNTNPSSHMNNGHFPLDAQSQFSAQAQLIEALAMQSLQVNHLFFLYFELPYYPY